MNILTRQQIKEFEQRKILLLRQRVNDIRQRIGEMQNADFGEHDDQKYNLLTQAYQLACAR